MLGQRREMCPILYFVAVLLAELDDLHEVLFRQYGACAVHDLASVGFHEVQTLLEDDFLDLRDLINTVKGEFPAEVRIATHYTSPGAGYVQHDPVTLLVQGLFKLGLVVMHLTVLDARTLQTLLGLHQDAFANVVQVNLSLIVHEGCKC